MRTRKERIFTDYQGYLVRMLMTIGGFKARYGHWPTSLRLPREALELLRDSALTPFGFQLLASKLRLVEENIETLIAEDDTGLRISYCEQDPSEPPPFGGADQWLWKVSFR